jgi:hypothetical protein
MRPERPKSSRGSAIVSLLLAVALCGAVSLAVLTTNGGRIREAETALAGERAFQLAEAGADWGLTQVRIRKGVVPTADFTETVAGAGSYVVRYEQGDASGADENGDGVVDDAGEHGYAVITCTGTSGGQSRSVQVIARRAVVVPSFHSAIQVNSSVPIFDFHGNAMRIDGREHFLDGAYDKNRPQMPAISSPAPVDVVKSEIGTSFNSQLVGAGSAPSIGQTPEVDVGLLVQQSEAVATINLAPGTHLSNATLGAPTESEVVVAYAAGNLRLSGGTTGAGVLAVNGDLTVSGAFQWVGIILVHGRASFSGGGNVQNLIGTLVSDVEADLNGSLNILYSTDAIGLASTGLSGIAVMSWRKVGNPAP